MAGSGITAIVTAYQRPAQTIVTLEKLQGCAPRPDEIIVHVDGSDAACTSAIAQTFPAVSF